MINAKYPVLFKQQDDMAKSARFLDSPYLEISSPLLRQTSHQNLMTTKGRAEEGLRTSLKKKNFHSNFVDLSA